MTHKGSSSQACAACKYQRRRCNSNCILAPYFPADQHKMFQNAHKLFGVSNIVKILNKVGEDQRDEAMKSIIYESDMRDRFPVHGCSFVTYQLEERLQQCEEELYRVRSLLSTFRSKERSCGQFQLENFVSSDGIDDIPADSIKSRDIKPVLWKQPPSQTYIGDIMSNDCSTGMKSQFRVPGNFDDMTFDSIVDYRPRYELKEACGPRCVVIHLSRVDFGNIDALFRTLLCSGSRYGATSPNHELKIAAACFSLKSVNLGKTISS